MDPFLDNNNAFERLLTEYRLHKRLIVAFDFDDTVYDFHKKGREYSQVIDLLKRCQEVGFHLTLLTDLYEGKKEAIHDFYTKTGITPDLVNDTPAFLPFGHCGKPYYNILLDDRAGLSGAYNLLLTIVEIAEEDQELR